MAAHRPGACGLRRWDLALSGPAGGIGQQQGNGADLQGNQGNDQILRIGDQPASAGGDEDNSGSAGSGD
ncbi:hypothetical protein D3C75_967490 [compost metagenome]